MSILATPYVNLIKNWYDADSQLRLAKRKSVRKYDRVMMISSWNHNAHYNDLLNSKLIKNQYILSCRMVE